MLVVDDLHAADESSLLLLRFIARELASTRVFLLGAYRDVNPLPGPPLAELLAALAGEPQARRLLLRGLSDGEVAEYVELTGAQVALETSSKRCMRTPPAIRSSSARSFDFSPSRALPPKDAPRFPRACATSSPVA